MEELIEIYDQTPSSRRIQTTKLESN